jgi:hypothetical protein
MTVGLSRGEIANPRRMASRMRLLYALGEKAKKNKKSSRALFMEYKKQGKKNLANGRGFFGVARIT